LPNSALKALVALVVVLFVSSLLLIPGQSLLAIGIEVLVVLVIGLIDCITILFFEVNSPCKMRAQLRIRFARVILASQMAALSFVIAGILLLNLGDERSLLDRCSYPPLLLHCYCLCLDLAH
jgi:hypothetical protein